MENKGTKWGWIIFWLIIFWPVGLFMLFRKLATDKSAIMGDKSRSLSIIGWVLTVIGVIGAIGLIEELSETGDVGAVFFVLAMAVGGILLIRKASQMKKTGDKYNKYISIIINQNVQSIDYIASAVGLPYGVVGQDLNDMISTGYLKDEYIHQGNREIHINQNEPTTQTSETSSRENVTETRVERCSGCGANNTVTIGKAQECEYCGTSISA